MEPSSTGTAAQRNCTDGRRSKQLAESFGSCSRRSSRYPSSRSRKKLSMQAAGKASLCRPRRTAARLSWPAGGLCSVTRTAPVAILVINNDITKRKRAEEVAQRSEKELRDVVNAVPAFVWSTLPDGAVDFVNERWLEFTGLSPQDALGWNWQAAVHPDDRSRIVADWRETLKNGRSTEGELRVRRADGEFRWWFFRYAPLYDEAGNITKWYGTGIDIEDRKRAESLFAGESRILEMVAKGDSLAEILDSLCLLVEKQADGVLASILV